MVNPFGDFDFSLLDTPEFGEDAVREELVAPLLRALGYSASPPYQIIRSRKLEHPFVYFGTVKKDITIIPDYLLERDGRPAWILDAKAPREAIDTGKNVEQAYSYAMHRDVRTMFYALCNGRRFTLWHVLHYEPLIDVELKDIAKVWLSLLDMVGCRSAWPMGIKPGFLPDMGMAMTKAGLVAEDNGKKYWQMFMEVRVNFIGKLKDDLYTITSAYHQENGSSHMMTFDFPKSVYELFLAEVPEPQRAQIAQALLRQPFKITLGDEGPVVTIVGEIGDKVFTNENESYRPFIAEEFVMDVAPW